MTPLRRFVDLYKVRQRTSSASPSAICNSCELSSSGLNWISILDSPSTCARNSNGNPDRWRRPTHSLTASLPDAIVFGVAKCSCSPQIRRPWSTGLFRAAMDKRRTPTSSSGQQLKQPSQARTNETQGSSRSRFVTSSNTVILRQILLDQATDGNMEQWHSWASRTSRARWFGLRTLQEPMVRGWIPGSRDADVLSIDSQSHQVLAFQRATDASNRRFSPLRGLAHSS